jgi:hypothetical protein
MVCVRVCDLKMTILCGATKQNSIAITVQTRQFGHAWCGRGQVAVRFSHIFPGGKRPDVCNSPNRLLSDYGREQMGFGYIHPPVVDALNPEPHHLDSTGLDFQKNLFLLLQ